MLLIRPAAQTDLIEIGDYIALDNPARALTFVIEIENLIVRDIANRPESFAARPDLGSGIRVARHRRYLVFFTYDANRIEIIRVLHGSRDLPTILA